MDASSGRVVNVVVMYHKHGKKAGKGLLSSVVEMRIEYRLYAIYTDVITHVSYDVLLLCYCMMLKDNISLFMLYDIPFIQLLLYHCAYILCLISVY